MKDLEWFRHDLVKKCFEDRLGNERRRSYHERAAKFFESLMEEKPNRQANDNTNIDEQSAEETRSIIMSYPYHLHMAGGKYHEKSFTHNISLAVYAFKKGDLDVAERCYKRAIDDAKYLGRLKDEMDCLWHMTASVYYVWGRYEEAVSNYRSLLKYYDSINDSKMRAFVLINIAMIHAIKGEYEQAMELYSQSLEIAKQIGDQYTIGRTLNNIALVLLGKEEYEESLSHVLQAYKILERLDIPPDLQRSRNILGYIKEKLGSEAYQRLVEKIKSQLS